VNVDLSQQAIDQNLTIRNSSIGSDELYEFVSIWIRLLLNLCGRAGAQEIAAGDVRFQHLNQTNIAPLKTFNHVMRAADSEPIRAIFLAAAENGCLPAP